MPLCGLTTVRRAVETDLTKLRYASTITEQNKRNVSSCWFTSFRPVWNFALQRPTIRNTMQQGVQNVTSNNCWELLANNVASVHWRIQGGARAPPAPLLLLDQTEARRAEKKFFLRPPPPNLRDWMTRLPPYLKVWIRHCNLHGT